MFHKLGPCLVGPPSTQLWQAAHLALKSAAPFFATPSSMENAVATFAFTSTSAPRYAFIFGLGSTMSDLLDVANTPSAYPATTATPARPAAPNSSTPIVC